MEIPTLTKFFFRAKSAAPLKTSFVMTGRCFCQEFPDTAPSQNIDEATANDTPRRKHRQVCWWKKEEDIRRKNGRVKTRRQERRPGWDDWLPDESGWHAYLTAKTWDQIKAWFPVPKSVHAMLLEKSPEYAKLRLGFTWDVCFRSLQKSCKAFHGS